MNEEDSQKQNDSEKKKTDEVTEAQAAAVGSEPVGSELVESEAGGSEPVESEPKRAAKRVARKRTAAKTSAAKRTSSTKAEEAASREADAKARVTVVKKLLKTVEEKLSAKDAKASLGDYIRLVQLHKELDEEAPREIKVTWVESGTTTTEPKPETARIDGTEPETTKPEPAKPDPTSGNGG